MSGYNDQSRLGTSARHRAESTAISTAAAKQDKNSRTVLKRAANSNLSQRMAVVAAGIALVMGVGSAGHATEQAVEAKDTAAQLAAQKSDATASSKPLSQATAEPLVPNETFKATPAPSTPAAPAPAAAAPAPAAPAPVPAAAPAPAAVAPQAAAPVAVNDPAAAKAYAASRLSAFGWGPEQMQSLITLWEKESNWRTTAVNASSGAYGIVQALPGNKMASIAPDWETNFRTQIDWGLQYIKERYGSPANALGFHYANNWY